MWLVECHLKLPNDQALLLKTFKNALFAKYDAPNVIVSELRTN
jgi:hypothetical protein